MNTTKKTAKHLLSVSILSIAGLFAGCAGDGSSGGGNKISLGKFIGGKYGDQIDAGTNLATAFAYVPDEDELGRTVVIAATNRWPLFDRPALTRYVTMVGLTLADSTTRPDGNWIFGILDTPEIGAYSGPNGYIMVTRGALAAMQDESELAAVLAHEMSHVIDGDGAKAVKDAKLVSAGTEAMSAADRRLAAFNQMSDHLVDKVLKSGWNQSQETNADENAVKLLIASGYDPMGLPRFLKRMLASTGGRAKPFGTHPGTADRINRTTSQIGSGPTGATNKDRFVKATAEARL